MPDNRNEQSKPAEGVTPYVGSRSYPGWRKMIGSILTMPPNQDVMTLQEAAEFFKCNPATLKRRVSALHIPYKRMGSPWRFSRKALEAWMANADNDKAA